LIKGGAFMILTGQIINDKYNILEQLGEGGMSFVYKAIDLESNVTFAVKFMKDRVLLLKKWPNL